MSRARLAAFTMVCLVALLIGAGAVVYGAQRADDTADPTAASAVDVSPDPATVDIATVDIATVDIATARTRPHIVFRNTATGPTRGRLAVVPLDRPDGPRALADLRCERVYATRSDGLCLPYQGGLPGSRAVVLDAALSPGRQLPVSGLPTRTRVSPDGALAVMTTFVEGHSYAHHGFSTATTIHDLRTGRSYGNLEDFRVLRDGKPYRSVDLNMWGVTFAGGSRFYATVASRGKLWLAEGDVADRELRIVRDGVECPSLSPDGTRIAYKKRSRGEPVTWRLHVLDLRTGRDVALAETRNVDDQVEWLDDEQVLYGRGRQVGDDPGTLAGDETDIWVVPADGSGRPRVLIPKAWSPAVIR